MRITATLCLLGSHGCQLVISLIMGIGNSISNGISVLQIGHTHIADIALDITRTTIYSLIDARETSHETRVKAISTTSDITSDTTDATSNITKIETISEFVASKSTLRACTIGAIVATPTAAPTSEAKQKQDDDPNNVILQAFYPIVLILEFVLVQHNFSFIFVNVAASWGDYIFSLPMRCP